MTSSDHAPSVSRTAWLVVILLMPVALLNYLDRQMLATMRSSVMSDIPSIGSDENWGTVLGVFKWVYAGLSPFAGYIADRFGKRYTICGSLFVWSAITWWAGHVRTYEELLWNRGLMGVSEAFYFPAALALIADYHTGSTRSRAVGMHQIAIYLGQIIGGFGGYVADAPHLGWRFALDFCGVFGMLYAIPLMMYLRDVRRVESGVLTPQLSVQSRLEELLSNKFFYLLVLYFTLPAMAGWVIRDWMPAILKDKFDLKQGYAGMAATIPWQVAAILSALLGGWLSDYWSRRNIRGKTFVSAIGMSCIVAAIFGVGNASTLAMAVTFLVVFGIGWGFFDCNNMPILSQIVRPELRATGYGIMNFVSISFGGLADKQFGRLKDSGVPLNVTFGIFASAAIISIFLVLSIRPKAELVNPPVEG